LEDTGRSQRDGRQPVRIEVRKMVEEIPPRRL
jgi:hypothetical protein